MLRWPDNYRAGLEGSKGDLLLPSFNGFYRQVLQWKCSGWRAGDGSRARSWRGWLSVVAKSIFCMRMLWGFIFVSSTNTSRIKPMGVNGAAQTAQQLLHSMSKRPFFFYLMSCKKRHRNNTCWVFQLHERVNNRETKIMGLCFCMNLNTNIKLSATAPKRFIGWSMKSAEPFTERTHTQKMCIYV